MVPPHAPTFFASPNDKTRAVPEFHHIKERQITTFSPPNNHIVTIVHHHDLD
jgi:hypothetical protein